MKTPRTRRKPTPPREPAPIVRRGPTLERLRALYKHGQVAAAEEMVDEVLRLWPGTDAASTALLLRGLKRRARGHRIGALADLERAAGASTHPDALTAACKAATMAELDEDAVTASRLFRKVVDTWPRTRWAANAAGSLALLEPDRADHWNAVWLATLQDVAAHPVQGSNDDLVALEDLAQHYADHVAGAACDAARAAAYARDLLRRATARGNADYAQTADSILTALETGRRRTDVLKLLAVSRDPRASRRTLE